MALSAPATYEFGDAFQRHALAVLARIPGGVVRYRSALDPTFFGSATLRTIAETLFTHVDTNRALPQKPTLLEELHEHVADEDYKRVEKSVERMYAEDVSDAKAVLQRVIEFGRQQAYVNATLKAAEELERGNREVRKYFDAAGLVGEDLLDLGIDYRRNVKLRREYYLDPSAHEDRISTGLPHLDVLMGGGLCRKELGVVLAPPKKGKCVGPEARIWTTTAGYRPMREVVTMLPDVVGIGERSQQPEVSRVVAGTQDSPKMLMRLQLRSGRAVDDVAVTHPILTARGWVPAAEVVNGDYVVGPCELPLVGVCDDDELATAWLHGVMCGDGGLTDRNPLLHLHLTDDEDIVREVQFTFPGLMDGKPFKTSEFGVRFTLSRSYFDTLERWGGSRVLSPVKRIPSGVWTRGRRAVAAFLSGLFDTDGSAYFDGRRPVAEFCSASRGLMLDVLAALHVLGVYAPIRRKEIALNGDTFEAWVVMLRDGESVRRFHDECAPYGAHHRKWLFLETARPTRGQFAKRLPPVVWERLVAQLGGRTRWQTPNIAEVFRKLSLKGDPRKGSEYARRAIARRSRVRVDVARVIGEVLDDPWIKCAASGNFVFDEVVDVRETGESPTFDIQVEGSHSYVVDGVLTHNTTTLINIAYGAFTAAQAYNVAHYSLEMHQDKVARRYDDRLMSKRVEIRGTDPERYGRMLSQRVKTFVRGRLFVKSYPTRTATVSKIRSHLTLLAVRGFTPDLIVVDYADIMKPERRLGEMRHEQAGIYEDLRQLADEFNAAVWTGSQASRGALEKDTVTIEDFAEAFEKAAIVDAAIAFCQTHDERVDGRCRLYAAALRNAEDGRTIECEIDRNRARIRSIALFDVSGARILLQGEQHDANLETTSFVTKAKRQDEVQDLKRRSGIAKVKTEKRKDRPVVGVKKRRREERPSKTVQ